MAPDNSPFPSQYVNLTKLDLRESPQLLEEVTNGLQQKRSGARSLIAAKRRRTLAPGTPTSEYNRSPLSSNQSISSIRSTFENFEHDGEGAEAHGGLPRGKCSSVASDRSRDETCTDSLKRHSCFIAKPYLYTPPSTNSDYSSADSSFYDTRSVTSTRYNCSSLSTYSDDGINPRTYSQSPGPDDSNNPNMHYPRTIDMCLDSPQTPGPWDLDSTNASENISPMSEIEILSANETEWTLFHRESLPESQSASLNMGGLLCPDSSIKCYSDVSKTARLDSSCFRSLLAPAMNFGDIGMTDDPISNATTRQAFIGDQIGSEVTAEPESYLAKEQGSIIPTCSLIHSAKTHDTEPGVDCTDNEDAGINALLSVRESLREMESAQAECEGSQLAMYLKKGSIETIEDWSKEIPDFPLYSENGEPESPSTSILLATAEEVLEDRVSRVLCDNPSLAQLLLTKLRRKDELSFILPLFSEDEERSPFELSYSHAAQERGGARKSASGSAPSTTGSKSTTGTSVTTPATSAGSAKDGGDEEGDDELPRRKRARKGPKDHIAMNPGSHERRRLRCHFHAKCPDTHNQKQCIYGGWLSIHNLRGHYTSNHTIIRCHKCFTTFEKKTEKNQHQRACLADGPPPSLEVIDCDKTDELEEVLSTFRTWQLDDEEDVDMKSWIIKYKIEFVNSSMTSDEAYDSRELAKWYRIWRALFPALQTPVPSPFQDASISPGGMDFERWLTIFDTVVVSQYELNQAPPVEFPEQVEWYKNALRIVNRLALARSGSSSVTSVQPGLRFDRRLSATPASSTNTAPNRSGIIESNPNTGIHRDESAHRVQRLGNSERSIRGEIVTNGGSSIYDVASPDTSLKSPYSAETRGAFGESPMIQRSGKFSRDLGTDTAIDSSPRRALDFNLSHPMSLNSSPIGISSPTPATMSSIVNPGSMMPPPPRQTMAHHNTSSNIKQQATQHYQPGPSVQNYQNNPFQYSINNTPSGLSPPNNNGNTGMFVYSNMQQNQTGQSRENMGIPDGKEIMCQYCMNTGYVFSPTGGQEECLSCSNSYSMHS